ncbi:MAG: NAD-dependent epimerase/dehydratase family protein [Micromonosporaceae bacterium]
MPREATPSRIVLVTGVSRYLGAVVAARLAADPRVARVVAVDSSPPEGEAAALLPPGDKVEFISADIRQPVIAKIIVSSGADTVVHMAVQVSASNSSARTADKELNVIGSMQLLAACQKAPALRTLVVKSSAAAYGASPHDPAMFTEDTAPRDLPRGGYAKDVIEVEGYVRGFLRRRTDVSVTVLRFAPFLGPQADTTLTRYFSLPVVPTALGYDPRMQFIHIDDALDVLHRSVIEDHPGVYNVAGEGVLLLSQAIRRAGRVPVPVPEIGLSGLVGFARRSGLLGFSRDQLDFLLYGRVLDTTRLIDEYGYRPRSTVDAFNDFVRGHQLTSVINPATAAAAENLLVDQFRQVRQALAGVVPSRREM